MGGNAKAPDLLEQSKCDHTLLFPFYYYYHFPDTLRLRTRLHIGCGVSVPCSVWDWVRPEKNKRSSIEKHMGGDAKAPDLLEQSECDHTLLFLFIIIIFLIL